MNFVGLISVGMVRSRTEATEFSLVYISNSLMHGNYKKTLKLKV